MNAVTMQTTALAFVLALTSAAAAAPTTVDRSPAQIADTGQASAANATELADDPGTCSTSRRRLWIESEGWIVRKITICR